jgi:acetyl-CoA C-acetyltransferase
MTEAYIYDAVRTGRGKAKPGGGLADVAPLTLLVELLHAVADRSSLKPAAIEDLIIGTATQTGAQGANIARAAAILAGWGSSATGVMVNRFCSSGIDAINVAAAQMVFGSANLVVAGGVESVSHTPMYSDSGPLFGDSAVVERAGTAIAMGVAADLVATLENIDRAELDAYGWRSQQRAAAAWRDDRFVDDVINITTPSGTDFATDEAIRAGTTPESLAALPPAFGELGAAGQDDLIRQHHNDIRDIRHLHTIGTSPTMVDGAALLLVGTGAAGREHGMEPLARVVAGATATVDPVLMLTAGQAAAEKVIRQSNLSPDDIAVFEVAEAFAATCLKFQRDLAVDDARFNPHGGTIAMGHAFGATGAILATNCIGELRRRDARYGVIAVSGAAGVGSASLLERVA